MPEVKVAWVGVDTDGQASLFDGEPMECPKTNGHTGWYLATATFTFSMKQNIAQSSADMTKTDGSFDKADAATGIIRLALTSTDLDFVGTYYGELKTSFTSGQIDKSPNITMVFERAITD